MSAFAAANEAAMWPTAKLLWTLVSVESVLLFSRAVNPQRGLLFTWNVLFVYN